MESAIRLRACVATASPVYAVRRVGRWSSNASRSILNAGGEDMAEAGVDAAGEVVDARCGAIVAVAVASWSGKLVADALSQADELSSPRSLSAVGPG